MADKIKFSLAFLLLAAGITGYYLVSESSGLRWPAVFAGVIAAAAVYMATESGRGFLALCKDSHAELKKVVWPSLKETRQMTLMVFVFVVVIALVLFLSDKFLEWVMYDLILGWGK